MIVVFVALFLIGPSWGGDQTLIDSGRQAASEDLYLSLRQGGKAHARLGGYLAYLYEAKNPLSKKSYQNSAERSAGIARYDDLFTDLDQKAWKGVYEKLKITEKLTAEGLFLLLSDVKKLFTNESEVAAIDDVMLGLASGRWGLVKRSNNPNKAKLQEVLRGIRGTDKVNRLSDALYHRNLNLQGIADKDLKKHRQSVVKFVLGDSQLKSVLRTEDFPAPPVIRKEKIFENIADTLIERGLKVQDLLSFNQSLVPIFGAISADPKALFDEDKKFVFSYLQLFLQDKRPAERQNVATQLVKTFFPGVGPKEKAFREAILMETGEHPRKVRQNDDFFLWTLEGVSMSERLREYVDGILRWGFKPVTADFTSKAGYISSKYFEKDIKIDDSALLKTLETHVKLHGIIQRTLSGGLKKDFKKDDKVRFEYVSGSDELRMIIPKKIKMLGIELGGLVVTLKDEQLTVQGFEETAGNGINVLQSKRVSDVVKGFIEHDRTLGNGLANIKQGYLKEHNVTIEDLNTYVQNDPVSVSPREIENRCKDPIYAIKSGLHANGKEITPQEQARAIGHAVDYQIQVGKIKQEDRFACLLAMSSIVNEGAE